MVPMFASSSSCVPSCLFHLRCRGDNDNNVVDMNMPDTNDVNNKNGHDINKTTNDSYNMDNDWQPENNGIDTSTILKENYNDDNNDYN